MKKFNKKKLYAKIIIAIATIVGFLILYQLIFLPIFQKKTEQWKNNIYMSQMNRIQDEQQKWAEEQGRQSMEENERFRKLEEEHRKKILLTKNRDGWTTYRDEMHGFEFQYPPGWISDMDKTGRAPMMIYRSETGNRGVYDESVLISIYIDIFDVRNAGNKYSNLHLLDLFSSCSSLFIDNEFLPETRSRAAPKCTRDFAMINNRKAVRISDETIGGIETGPRAYRTLLVRMDENKVLQISIWAPLPDGNERIKTADKIFSTLKFSTIPTQ